MAVARTLMIGLLCAGAELLVAEPARQLRGEQNVTEGAIGLEKESRNQDEVLDQTGATSNRSVSAATTLVHHIWPGTGFASIACAGVWEKANAGGYKIASILGSSGGAGVAVILLASESVSTLERVYSSYATAGYPATATDTSSCWGDTDACWWQEQYLNLMGSSAFQRVKAKGRVSVQCSEAKGFYSKKATVLYNFQTPLQAAQAYAASGNAAMGEHWVTGVGWCMDWDTMTISQDGIPSELNTQGYDVWWYNTGSSEVMNLCCPSDFNCPMITTVTQNGYQCIDKMINVGRTNYDDSNLLQVNPWWAKGWSLSDMTATWKDLR
ncbi:unnamed protein product [Polarella glacialis]|uniref:Uncharacterized protein n=1 Tax=Polarella glacialis TaxID=89957 RepID=A0A813FMS8_POLGL|nr:unnamed protein product [Polarella glacialis]